MDEPALNRGGFEHFDARHKGSSEDQVHFVTVEVGIIGFAGEHVHLESQTIWVADINYDAVSGDRTMEQRRHTII